MPQDAQHAFPFAPSDDEADDDTKLDDGSYAWPQEGPSPAPAVLSLALDVRDPSVVSALAAIAEGRPRDEFALDALRIGVLALEHAASRAGADQVRSAGDHLVAQLQQALDANAKLSKERTETVLREYFDPKSGRLSERVARLVADDGELAQVLEKQLHGEGSPLTTKLAALLGAESPLMRQLDPNQANGLLARLQKTVDEQLRQQREHVLRQFSLDHDDSALARLVRELTDKHGDLKKDVQSKIDAVVKEFSLDKEDSALSRLVQNVDRAQRTISSEFSLDNKASGLSRVKDELRTILEAHIKTNAEFQEEVKVALARLTQRRESAAASPEHGAAFEEAVFTFLHNEAQQRGDLAESTGATTGLVKNCKVGDALLCLGPETPAPDARIVFEAKEALGYSETKARQELDTARKNRGADFGVFVWSKATAPAGMKPLQRFRSDLVVVWDAEDSATDPYLLAAIEIARACACEFHRGAADHEVDYEGIEKAVNEIERRAEGLNLIRKPAETIRSSSDKILERVRIDQQALERQVAVLREKLAAVRAAGAV